jgi:1-deoxy-D-xylulose-5-phosphate synthase
VTDKPLLSSIDDPKDLRKLPPAKLPQVAEEIREYMIEVLSKIGGHTAASLGPVELAIALHYCFDTPRDRLVWDVGHQAYSHKILTGRRDRFPTVKQHGGISGFLRREESEYDVFNAGHAGTSLSAAMGMATARDIKGENFHVVAVIGDGGLTAGMAMEALNHAGHDKRRLIVVLNDNEMSIAPNVGAVSGYLNRIRGGQPYNTIKDEIEEVLKSIPGVGELRFKSAKLVKDAISRAFVPGVLAEELGFRYYGPINGHDTEALLEVFNEVKGLDHPVLIHTLTMKGKGYEPAERDPYSWHGTTPFDIATGAFVKPKATAPSYTQVFAETTVRLMEADPNVVAITAAMPDGTGLNKVSPRFPDRVIDVGIAEQHAVTLAAGMALEGIRPICAIYSTFLQRAFDQVAHDVCLMDIPVAFAIDRGGLVGADGPTHHGLLDFTYLRSLPNMIVMAPKDENELARMLKTAVYAGHPAAVRFPRGNGVGVAMDETLEAVEIGKGELLREGLDVAIVAIGHMVPEAVAAAERLAAEGINAAVVNARFVKPLDEELLLALADTVGSIVTVEDHFLAGGFGSALLELFEARGRSHVRVSRIGVPDGVHQHGTIELLRARFGLDADGIATRVRELIASDRRIGAVR